MLAAFGATLVPIMVCESVPTMPPGAVHDQVPVLVPVLVTVPEEAASATVSPSGSAKVPVLVGAEPSATLTAALSAPIAGARLTFVVTHVLKAKSCPTRGL